MLAEALRDESSINFSGSLRKYFTRSNGVAIRFEFLNRAKSITVRSCFSFLFIIPLLSSWNKDSVIMYLAS